MKNIDVILGKDHLEDISSAKPIPAIKEIIWNAFDSNSLIVKVLFHKYSNTNTIEKVTIQDQGEGIPHHNVSSLFGSLGESWKKDAKKNGDRSLHGQYGKGRFKAFSLGEIVVWSTCVEDKGKYFRYSIKGNANNIKRFEISEPSESSDNIKGTQVEIFNLAKQASSLATDSSKESITKEYALYLTEYPHKKLFYDNAYITPSDVWLDKKEYNLGDIEIESAQENVSVSIIEWKFKTPREIHYCDENGFSLFNESAGKLVRSYGVDFTVYIKSPFIKRKFEENVLSLGSLESGIKDLKDKVIDLCKKHFVNKEFLQKTKIVDEWKEQNIYPYERTPQPGSIEEAEQKVFNILAVNVESYLTSFSKSNNNVKKFTFKLLSQALKDNPNSVRKILSEVLVMSSDDQDSMAKLLEKTTLPNIIKASQVVSDRLNFLTGLEQLLFDDKTKKKLLERDQLHKLLENEAWLFREDFNLSRSENTLNQVLQYHADKMGIIYDPELPVVREDGTTGRVDLLLSKARQPREGELEHLVVELKRPTKKIDLSVINQVKSYAYAVSNDGRFDKQNTKWVFVAVSNEIDPLVQDEISQDDRPYGLLYSKGNVSIWIYTWGELIGQARSRLMFFSNLLDIDINRDSATNYLKETYAKFIPTEINELEV
ncbi:ATP-binding protein [Enterobacter asburiae]|nr:MULTISPECIES: ATP-binding protein [Enterobacteriaceae]EJG2381315.1 ATP-binding protein [Raoultella ornithinolytica]MDV0944991.1 ATP-binding protein [Enterobacter asburiae]MDV1002589.1 ATP-binding protein [Enterobacter asburiae]MDV1099603.1 ATP-binding protein [Raoultella ornithinolytica]HDT6557468.1 ATP-binding protein [Raoultella ornithinolytica]